MDACTGVSAVTKFRSRSTSLLLDVRWGTGNSVGSGFTNYSGSGKAVAAKMASSQAGNAPYCDGISGFRRLQGPHGSAVLSLKGGLR